MSKTNKRGEYECALSNLVSEGGLYYKKDKMGDVPAGWIEVRMRRRIPSPAYLNIQNIKARVTEALLMNMPPDAREVQREAVVLQIESQYRAIERDTPPFFTEEEIVYIAPPESSEEIAEAVNEIRASLGLEKIDLFPDLLAEMGVLDAAEEEADEEG